MPRTPVQFGSLLAATDVDVLPDTAIVADRGSYVVVRTPSNPQHHWGNFLVFRDAPAVGDRERWEGAFDEEFGSDRAYVHYAFCWDAVGEDGAAIAEFVDAAGYDADRGVALVAAPGDLSAHPRSNTEATVVQLDPDADAELWAGVLDVQVECRDPEFMPEEYRAFAEARMADRRIRFRAGDGAWFAAVLDDRVVASCGVMVTQGRARYQSVDTHPEFRRRGLASRVVFDAGRTAVEQFGAEQLVIGADAEYHALPLYESLGFTVRERSLAVCWWRGGERAAQHPRIGSAARPA